MKQVLSIALLLLFFPLSFLPTIVEHKEFCSILSYIDHCDHHAGTCIVLDIDNTLAHPAKLIGSDQWVTYHLNKKIAEGLDFKQALQAVLPLYFEIQHIIDLVPAEQITPSIVKELQNRGITVMGLTSRSREISNRTITQLAAIGIDLSVTALGQQELIGFLDAPYIYKNGIIFCSSNDKGKVLKEILNHFNHKPNKIIAVDDKEKYLHSIKKMIDADIVFIGIRYSYCDDKVLQFDPLIAQQELYELFPDYMY